jgi:hypothetical protein
MTDRVLALAKAAPAPVWPLAFLLACTLYGLLRAVFSPRRAPAGRRRSVFVTGSARPLRLRWLHRLRRPPGVPRRDHPAVRRKAAQLAACGLRVDAAAYLFWKRILLAACAAGWAAAQAAVRDADGIPGVHAALFVLFPAAVALLSADGLLLERLQQARRHRIMRELDAVSRHLLYTGGHAVNLHARLLRCLPFTRVLRADWYRLTADWYQGADEALRRFRERVGTEEARAFAETLDALRQHEDERYYGLLRERIEDNKAKLELLKESRTEALGYLLIVLAGAPVMYTFRLFIHPWVAEGQRLFQMLE